MNPAEQVRIENDAPAHYLIWVNNNIARVVDTLEEAELAASVLRRAIACRAVLVPPVCEHPVEAIHVSVSQTTTARFCEACQMFVA